MINVPLSLGISSEFAYEAALASIAASIGAWGTSRAKEDASTAKAERWGTFAGLRAPTSMELGNSLKVDEK